MIPKIIHYTWLSQDPYPKLVQHCMASWQNYLPDYQFKCWTLSDFKASEHAWVHEAYAHKKYAYAADYIRFYALQSMGGIYLDADVEVYKSLNPLLNQEGFIGFEGPMYLEAAVMGAVPQSDWVKKCFLYFKDQHFISNDGQLNMITLPQVIKPILEAHFEKSIEDNHNIQILPGLTLYPQVYFSPKSQLTLEIHANESTYTVHHFEGSWFSWSVRLRRKIKKMLPKNLYMLIRNVFKPNA